MQINTRLYLILAAVLLLFAGAIFWTIYRQNLTAGSTDFVPTWWATRLFFQDGVDPYSERIGEESQQDIYGKPAEPDQDPFLFFYPFYVMFYFAPLGFLSYKAAAAIYMTVLIMGLITAFALQLSILRWLPSPLMLGMGLVFTIVAYFSVRGILLAQHAILGYVLHIVALWAIIRKQNTLAGIALALSTIKPQTGILIVPLLLLWSWRYGQRHVVVWFTLTFGLLCGASFILQPSWFGEWLNQVTTYESSTVTIATAEIISHAITSLPDAVKDAGQVLITLILAIPLLLFWKRVFIEGDTSELLWGYCLTLTFNLSVAPRVATTYYVELYFVLLIVAMILSQQRRKLWVYVGGFVLLLGYWVLHIATVPPVEEVGGAGREASIVYVVFPVIIWGLLFIFRRDFPTYQSITGERISDV